MSSTGTDMFKVVTVPPPRHTETGRALDVRKRYARRSKRARNVRAGLARIAWAARGPHDVIPQQQTIYESLGIRPTGR